MNILIADERKKYHQALLNNGVLTIDKNGVPSNADTSSRLSKAIAKDIADRLMAETHEKAVGQTSGAKFEQINMGISCGYISKTSSNSTGKVAYNKVGK